MNISSWLLRAFSALLVGGVAFFVALFFHNVDHISSFSSLTTAIIQKISEINSKIPIWYLVPPVFFVGEFLCAIGENLVQHCVNADEGNSISPRGRFEKTIKKAFISYQGFGSFILNKDGVKKHSDEAFNFSEMHFAFGYFWGGIGVLFLASTFGSFFCFDITFGIGLIAVFIITLFILIFGSNKPVDVKMKYGVAILGSTICTLLLGCYIGCNMCLIDMILSSIAALIVALFAICKAIDYRKFANLIIYLNSDNNRN